MKRIVFLAMLAAFPVFADPVVPALAPALVVPVPADLFEKMIEQRKAMGAEIDRQDEVIQELKKRLDNCVLAHTV